MTTVSVVRDGATQYIKFPEGFRFECDTLYLHTVGNTLVLLPEDTPWDSF